MNVLNYSEASYLLKQFLSNFLVFLLKRVHVHLCEKYYKPTPLFQILWRLKACFFKTAHCTEQLLYNADTMDDVQKNTIICYKKKMWENSAVYCNVFLLYACCVPAVLGTGKFFLPSLKNQQKCSQWSDFPLGNWEQLKLPTVMLCKMDLAFQYGINSSKKGWKKFYFTRHMLQRI